MNFDTIKRKITNYKKKQGHIQTVAQSAGWSKKQAKQALENAKAQGMPYFRYVNNECWNLTDEEIVQLNEKIIKQKEDNKHRKEVVDSICQQHDVSAKTVSAKLKVAKDLKIKENVFVKKHLWELKDAELKEYAKTSKKLRANRKRDYEFYVSVVCQKTGWDREKAETELANAKELGISNLKYIQKNVWKKSDAEVERLVKFLSKDKQRISGNKEKYITEICKETGWSIGKAELEVAKAKANCGASYEDFIVFRLFEKTPEEQRKFVTLSMFNYMRIKFNNHDESCAEFDDKAKFNENFADLIVHKWFINENLTYEEFLSKIDGLNKLIIKPLTATQGIGIEIAQCNVSDEDNKKLYDHIMKLKKSIVEEYIIQHDEMMKFCPTAVNTVRVMTLHYEGECKLLYSVFRMGKDKGVDNFHAGGVAAGVDLQTGVVCTNAVDLNGNVFTHSPATNRQIKGFQIPHWDKVVDLCNKASGRFDHTGLVGWDFAITEDGVELIEGNPGGSYVVAQMPYVEDGIGLFDIMVGPYLPEFFN